MISFEKELDISALSCDELEYFNELKTDIEASLPDECEVKFAISTLCLIARIFDFGRYSFIYPIALSDKADEKSALLAVNEYAMREAIERIFTDVPKESVSVFLESFRHLDIDAVDANGESFRVKIKTECELLDTVPKLSFVNVTLDTLCENDAEAYARLLRDEGTNEFWGYDFREDFSENVSDSFFIENARQEFLRGESLTLAVRFNEKFIGEATFYAFDGMGGAEIAIRLLPENRGMGLGKSTVSALFEYAAKIGLTKLSAFIDKRNTASIKLFSNFLGISEESDTRVKFSCNLY
jgi:RimJ/RimL family protein N-acetyltransferase